jgi:hypothetical protein
VRHVVLSEAQHALLLEALATPEIEGDAAALDDLVDRIRRAHSARVPPPLLPSLAPAHERGPHRRVLERLAHESGRDALLLDCGHIVSRNGSARSRAYCEACVACQDLSPEDPR